MHPRAGDKQLVRPNNSLLTENLSMSLLHSKAEQGDAEAQYQLGLCFIKGDGVGKDIKKAVQWLSVATKQGHVKAQLKLIKIGQDYLKGKNGIEKKAEEAVQLFTLTAEQKSSSAQFYLGWCYYQGLGIQKDINEAVRLFWLAANQGNPKAQTFLGKMYTEGIDFEKDEKKAVQMYQLATSQGYAQGQMRLGDLYKEGIGVEKDEKEAIRLYRLAANQGSLDAQCMLGSFYLDGIGVAKNEEKAAQLYRQAADRGHPEAQYNLVWCYKNGHGVKKNMSEAIQLCRLAANQGMARAQTQLGFFYENGQGVKKDDKAAVRLYCLAADQGDAQAQMYLGDRYLEGIGVQKDEKEAIRLYRLAANQGSLDAQCSLGWCYINGIGVKRNKQVAIQLFHLSADQGHKQAQLYLDELLLDPENLNEAPLLTSCVEDKTQASVTRNSNTPLLPTCHFTCIGPPSAIEESDRKELGHDLDGVIEFARCETIHELYPFVEKLFYQDDFLLKIIRAEEFGNILNPYDFDLNTKSWRYAAYAFTNPHTMKREDFYKYRRPQRANIPKDEYKITTKGIKRKDEKLWKLAEKKGLSKQTSFTFISPKENYFPPPLNFDRHCVQVGIGLSTKLKSIKIQRISLEDSNSYFYQYMYKSIEDATIAERDFVTDLEMIPNKNKSIRTHNEVMARIKFDPAPHHHSQILVAQGNLESRLVGQIRANDLTLRLKKLYDEEKKSLLENYTVPIGYYFGTTKFYERYSEANQDKDLNFALEEAQRKPHISATGLAHFRLLQKNNFVLEIKENSFTIQQLKIIIKEASSLTWESGLLFYKFFIKNQKSILEKLKNNNEMSLLIDVFSCVPLEQRKELVLINFCSNDATMQSYYLFNLMNLDCLEQDEKELMELLKDSLFKFDFDVRGPGGNSLYDYAIKHFLFNVADQLAIRANYKINSIELMGNALNAAIKLFNLPAAMKILARQPNAIEFIDKSGNLPLHWAVYYHNLPTTLAILATLSLLEDKNGADKSAKLSKAINHKNYHQHDYYYELAQCIHAFYKKAKMADVDAWMELVDGSLLKKLPQDESGKLCRALFSIKQRHRKLQQSMRNEVEDKILSLNLKDEEDTVSITPMRVEETKKSGGDLDVTNRNDQKAFGLPHNFFSLRELKSEEKLTQSSLLYLPISSDLDQILGFSGLITDIKDIRFWSTSAAISISFNSNIDTELYERTLQEKLLVGILDLKLNKCGGLIELQISNEVTTYHKFMSNIEYALKESPVPTKRLKSV